MTFGHFRRAVTLLEVMLAMGILVFLSSMTYWFYFSSLKSRNDEWETDRKLQLARAVLNRLSTEIRQSSSKISNGVVGLRGEEERLWLSTVAMPTRGRKEWFAPSDEPPPAQYDMNKVTYSIARHPEILDDDGIETALGLARVEVRIPRAIPVEQQRPKDENADNDNSSEDANAGEETPEEEAPEEEVPPVEEPETTDEQPLAGDEAFVDGEEENDPSLGPDINWEELYAPEIHYLRFCYYVGFTWWDKWDLPAGSENPLPQLVMVTIGFEPQPPVGEGLGVSPNEEFCKCMNRDPVDCPRLAKDMLTMTVRIPQADPFFRSRVGRETQALVESLAGPSEEEQSEGGSK